LSTSIFSAIFPKKPLNRFASRPPQGETIMKKVFIAFICTLVLPSVSFAANSIREGLWEITSRVEMPGMPIAIPPTIMKHCYSKTDVADQKKVIARQQDCKVTDMKTSGNKVSWTMKCTGKQAATMTGETVFGGDSYTSIMHMKAEGHDMTTKVKGKRIGDCQ
jgi:hypothetical protein